MILIVACVTFVLLLSSFSGNDHAQSKGTVTSLFNAPLVLVSAVASLFVGGSDVPSQPKVDTVSEIQSVTLADQSSLAVADAQEESGVTVTVTKARPDAPLPKPGDKLTMHYTGTLKSNGKKFDSSLDRGTPFKFTIGVGQVIKGWDEGVLQLHEGEKAILDIKSDYGYGARGAGRVIPPNADLMFEVELLKIN